MDEQTKKIKEYLKLKKIQEEAEKSKFIEEIFENHIEIEKKDEE